MKKLLIKNVTYPIKSHIIPHKIISKQRGVACNIFLKEKTMNARTINNKFSTAELLIKNNQSHILIVNDMIKFIEKLKNDLFKTKTFSCPEREAQRHYNISIAYNNVLDLFIREMNVTKSAKDEFIKTKELKSLLRNHPHPQPVLTHEITSTQPIPENNTSYFNNTVPNEEALKPKSKTTTLSLEKALRDQRIIEESSRLKTKNPKLSKRGIAKKISKGPLACGLTDERIRKILRKAK